MRNNYNNNLKCHHHLVRRRHYFCQSNSSSSSCCQQIFFIMFQSWFIIILLTTTLFVSGFTLPKSQYYCRAHEHKQQQQHRRLYRSSTSALYQSSSPIINAIGLALPLPKQRNNNEPSSPPPTWTDDELEQDSKEQEKTTSILTREEDIELIKQQQKRRDVILTCALAYGAGFGDVPAHRMYGCFLNMCTGNTIRATMAICEGHVKDSIMGISVVFGYVIGNAIARYIRNKIHYNNVENNNNNVFIDKDLNKNNNSSLFKSGNNNNIIKSLFIQQRFAQLSNTGKICLLVAPIVLTCFTYADMISYKVVRAILQAIAYGMIHMTAQDATNGTVLFAITGHWAGIAKSTVDVVTTNNNDDSNSNSKSLLIKNTRMVLSFITGIVSAIFLLDRILPAMSSSAIILPKNLLLQTLPIHTLVGTIYASLLIWFGLKHRNI